MTVADPGPATDRYRHLPRSGRLRIGLLGGSFDPPHRGHRELSLLALKRLGLDQVWWLISPRNPLKGAPSASLATRAQAARALASHPRIIPTVIEAAAGSSFTYDTLRWLQKRARDCRFVWLMGADNLATFHHWRRWRGIAAMLPIAVIDRPGAGFRALASPAAKVLRACRRRESAAPGLAWRRPPAWTFLHGRHWPISSTSLRAGRPAP